MRLFLSAALLLASTAAVPALAQDNPPPHHDGGQPNGDHQGGDHQGGGRPGGAPSGARPGGGAPQGQPHAQPGPQGGQRPGGFDRGPQGGAPDRRGDDPGRPAFPVGPGPVHGGQGGYRGPLPGNDGGTREGGTNVYRGNQGRPDGAGAVRGDPGAPGGYPRGGPGYSGGYQRGGPGGGRGNPGGGDWNRGWRGDQRYNWQGYRDGHRDSYHVDRYRPPYGYGFGYRRYGIGFQLDAGFFGQQYWIGDPGYYHLPPAYGPYRWVRYYNDALLVNIYNGMIADEIPDFFW